MKHNGPQEKGIPSGGRGEVGALRAQSHIKQDGDDCVPFTE